MNVLVCDTSKEDQIIETLPTTTTANPAQHQVFFHIRKGKHLGNLTWAVLSIWREQKQTLISHYGVWLISNSWCASSNKHKCRVNIVKQEEVNADMFTAYQTVFEGFGYVPGKQTIKMNSNVTLVGKNWRK